MFGLGPAHLAIIAVIAIMLYGDRLPEVARSFGKQFSEFRKGMSHVEREFKSALLDSPSSSTPESSYSRRPSNYNPIDDGDDSTAPKFEPPPAE
ncbi:MAG TPA: twin-arginine translocase TatA/TatE family subunit [Pirellulales bacterium]|jgi:sec-independent protein translocase protein TatA|nr:twin-arginine translocase TatA/TatE family subunit [Pirellulales bacterium]